MQQLMQGSLGDFWWHMGTVRTDVLAMRHSVTCLVVMVFMLTSRDIRTHNMRWLSWVEVPRCDWQRNALFPKRCAAIIFSLHNRSVYLTLKRQFHLLLFIGISIIHPFRSCISALLFTAVTRILRTNLHSSSPVLSSS
jgi:hypothetical protein